MSEEKMNGIIEKITTSNGKTIEVDPSFIMESIDDVGSMLDGQLAIIKSVKAIIKRGIAKGMTPSDASQVALELQRRAATKANSLVNFDDDKKEDKERKESNGATDEKLKESMEKVRLLSFNTEEEAEKAKQDILSSFERLKYVTAAHAYALTGENLSADDPMTEYGWKGECPEIHIFMEDGGGYALELPEPVNMSEEDEESKENNGATDKE